MITKANRFHGHNSLRHVYQKGKTVRVGQLAIRYLYNDRRKAYRCAVVVSKKVDKSAVTRNRIRRRLYEVVRRLEISQPYDIVITVFDPGVSELPDAKLNKLVIGLVGQAGLVTGGKHAFSTTLMI